MNFTYALENGYQNYLANNITGSCSYPIRRGFSTGSFDLPSLIVVHCSDWKPHPEMPWDGNMIATLHVCVETNFLTSTEDDTVTLVDSSANHDLAVSEIDRLCRDAQGTLNWINNPSSSIYLNAPEWVGGSNVIKESSWETQYHFDIRGQQLFTTSSVSNFN